MNTSPYPEFASDLKEARTIHKQHGKSYFFATRWLPRRAREATHILYAWLRIPDDWVDDEELSPETKQRLLDDWEARWASALSGAPTEHPILRSAAWLFREFQFPDAWGQAFLSAMRQDLTKERYKTYDELAHYMHGSAGVVGQMMSRIIGCDVRALPYAELNGYAMQLTNFLRDIGEDYRGRGRIYLPQADMDAYGVLESDFETGSPALTNLIKAYITKTRQLYKAAQPGIGLVEKPGRYPFRLASRLYAAILDKIEANHHDVITKRAHTKLWEKVIIALREL